MRQVLSPTYLKHAACLLHLVVLRLARQEIAALASCGKQDSEKLTLASPQFCAFVEYRSPFNARSVHEKGVNVRAFIIQVHILQKEHMANGVQVS